MNRLHLNWVWYVELGERMLRFIDAVFVGFGFRFKVQGLRLRGYGIGYRV